MEEASEHRRMERCKMELVEEHRLEVVEHKMEEVVEGEHTVAEEPRTLAEGQHT